MPSNKTEIGGGGYPGKISYFIDCYEIYYDLTKKLWNYSFWLPLHSLFFSKFYVEKSPSYRV
jgi:hypothetical protein